MQDWARDREIAYLYGSDAVFNPRHTYQLKHTSSSENINNPTWFDQYVIPVERPENHLQGYRWSRKQGQDMNVWCPQYKYNNFNVFIASRRCKILTLSVNILVWDLKLNNHHVRLLPGSTEHAGEIARLFPNRKMKGGKNTFKSKAK